MVHLCDLCPGKEGLLNYLKNVFLNNGYDFDDIVNYKQWVKGIVWQNRAN